MKPQEKFMHKSNYCIIMAGGVGSRFWPMSRTNYPKQFLDILGVGQTLLQQTYERLAKVCLPENIFIITHEQYRELVAEQLPLLPMANILCEPARKNTAPCIAYACFKIAQLDPNANIVVAPSDHLILNQESFVTAIHSAIEKASSKDCLITLGITPTRPDTGYGYIQFINSDDKERDSAMYKVKTFTEKPDLDLANFFLNSGDFLWNSGIFVWSVNSILKALEEHSPELYATFKEGEKVYNTPAEHAFLIDAFTSCKNISIDYAVMEKAQNVYVRKSSFGWSDLGTWGSLYDQVKKDENQNAVVGKNVMLYNTDNCIVNVPNDKLVVVDGLSDYIIVESQGVLLICKKQDEQQIRSIVNDVKIIKGEQYI